jgi:4-hydroxybutyrate CoA-transferase
MLTAGDDPTTAPQQRGSFRHNVFFAGSNTRAALHEGRADFTPIFLSEIPAPFRTGQLPLDVAIVQAAPPDEHGFCSLGVEVGARCRRRVTPAP